MMDNPESRQRSRRANGQDGAPRIGSGDRGIGLASALRERTRSLHVRAERSGIVREILRGRASTQGYALFLRNLLPAYQRMEQGLERHRHTPGVRAIAQPALYRAPALERDLEAICGPGWRQSLPLLRAGERYARQINAAAEDDGTRLIGHAYTRYLGDLHGGQIMQRILARSLGLGARGLGFYDFSAIADPEQFKADYRDALDQAALELGDCAGVVDEAALAFELNIEVSMAVQDAAGAST